MFFGIDNASMLKRISAWILDFILIAVVATGFGYLLSVCMGYDARYEQLTEKYEYYSKEYNVDISVTDSGTEEDENTAARRKAAYEAMNADTELQKQYTLVMNYTLVILSVSLLLAIITVDFIIPLFLKNGQTPGKKIFSICLMRTDQTKLRPVNLFIRTVLGKYAIETMVPVYIMIMLLFGSIGFAGTVTIMLILTLQIIMMAVTKTNSAIHDILAGTVVVDEKSQKIFDSLDDKIEFEKQQNQTT